MKKSRILEIEGQQGTKPKSGFVLRGQTLRVKEAVKAMNSNVRYLSFCWMASASPIKFESDRPNALASDLETFRVGFRKPLSIKPMYVGCKPAFSASASCESFIAVLCRLSTMAKASDISKRRIKQVCRGHIEANTDNSLDLTAARFYVGIHAVK
jgi:hypothetical protein